MATDNYRFAESDSLLCYHGPMLYEAKCLKRRKSSDGKAQYFIHYKGWNSKWEEWVDDDRVLAVNTANMNKMASLKAMHSNSKKSGAKRSITVAKDDNIQNTPPPMKGRKRKHSEISSESAHQNQNEVKLETDVQSPAEPKPKKRGRPPKTPIVTSKIEPEVELKIEPKNEPDIEPKKKHDIEPKKKPDIEPKKKPEIESKKKLDIEPKKKPEIEQKKKPKIEPVVKPKVEPDVQPKTHIKEDPEIESKIKIEVKPDIMSEVEVKVNSAIESKVKCEVNPGLIDEPEIELSESVEKIESTNEEDTTSPTFVVPAPVPIPIVIPTLEVPLMLKKRLAYDWSMVNIHDSLIKFPEKCTVEQVIRDYVRSKMNQTVQKERAINVGLAITQYFNLLADSQLLYDKERENEINTKALDILAKKKEDGDFTKYLYKKALYPKTYWSSVYGPIFLLRLIVKFPRIIPTFRYTEKQFIFVVQNFHDFLKFLEERFKSYFTDDDYNEYIQSTSSS